ncbi:MAG: MFS transporter, partial [Clostridia bacterium]|nr:MFS transporter [Clostridia bacterium]
MKLNNKRTVLIGLAFFSICAFWQMYDNIIPLILKYRYGISDGASGYIMALDNVLAVFLLPVFGALSDKKNTRMPFIMLGTAAAVILTICLSFAKSFSVFFVMLGLLLIAMGVYRSPAVALMPDVTPKPLRSKANAIINLMGALGGVYTLAMTGVLIKGNAADNPSYLPLFIAVAGLMAVSVLIMRATTNEQKFKAEAAAINDALDAETAAKYDEPIGTGHKLPKDMFRSLMLILFSVAFWYMGYNAVTTAFSRYATEMWGQNVSGASTCLMIATVGAVISYIPIGALASKIGRKRTILIGV